MPRTPAAFLALLAILPVLVGAYEFSAPDWAVRATFPARPKEDNQTVPTAAGDQLAQRRYHEKGTERAMVIRFVYPLVPAPNAREQVYRESVETLMSSRPGELRADEMFMLGDFAGRRLLIEHRRDRTHREVRLLLVGGSLYVISAEWPGGRERSAAAAKFLNSFSLQPDFTDPRVVEERERWRTIQAGRFSLRYDATRWFRDPQAPDPNSIVLLRLDELAEAEFITDPTSRPDASMEEQILSVAREHAESVKLHRRGKKFRGSATVEELRFAVRMDGVTYENHGYFYAGPEGTLQLRAWSPEANFGQVESDISELLDGLTVREAGSKR